VSRRARLVLLVIGLLGLAAIVSNAVRVLPPPGHHQGAYAATLVMNAVAERHATDVVFAVNFDYRGFDTLGEELILYVSVLGVGVLLRRQAGDDGDSCEDDARSLAKTSDAVRLLAVGLVGFTVVFGLYICTHGQISPGGGFQGGVILATAPLVVYLAAEPRTFARLAPEWLVHLLESLGAAGYVAMGALAFISGRAFLTNVLPLGTSGDVLSSGTIAAINAMVGLEVAAGFVSLLLVFVEEALARRLKAQEEEESR